MSDIFISYANKGRSKVAPLAQVLEAHGWSVFWDPEILPGQRWRKVIDKALHEARCVIVVWTKASVESDWVLEEAGDGSERGILVPVLMEDARIPLGFRRTQAARLIDWQGDGQYPGIGRLKAAVESLIGSPGRAEISEEESGGEDLSPPPTFTNDLGVEFVLIPAGSFQMGSTSGYVREKPVHRVTISKPFYLSVHVVTQRQWKAVMETEPWKGKGYVKEGNDYPAMYVSWEEAQAFIEKQNPRDEESLHRLPTEAEWKYACRAGSTTEYRFGNKVSQLRDYAWYDANTDAVGEELRAA